MRAHALRRGLVVAAAESLTGGELSAVLAQGGDAADWFAGGVVAYRRATKQRVLGVPEGSVVNPRTARTMAEGVLRLTGADAAVAVTGVGGPGEEEGEPPGTVWICVATRAGAQEFDHAFEGAPEEVVAQTIGAALRHLGEVLGATVSPAATPRGR